MKIKALLLMVVFSLNTIVSFACSVGLLDFSKHHHHGDKTSATQAVNKSHSHTHREKQSHTHNSDHHHNHGNAEKPHNHDGNEKNCCSDGAVKLNETDKTVTKSIQNLLPLSVDLLAAIHTFILGNGLYTSAAIKSSPPFVRSWTPTTIQDLRIVIQSFQI